MFKSKNNSMAVRFYSEYSSEGGGFTAKVNPFIQIRTMIVNVSCINQFLGMQVLFGKSIQAGCGGEINLVSSRTKTFRTQKGSTYESLENCLWGVVTSPGKSIKFTINSMDVRNSTDKRGGDMCNGDFLEVHLPYLARLRCLSQ